LPAPKDLEDTALLVAATREAGVIARNYFHGSYKSWRKEDGNPVTEADIAVNDFLKASLLYKRPDYGWLSEESADVPARLERERVFIVDPIDGTYGFLKGRPQFTIVAAVVAKGRPIAGAIYNPLTEEMFEATKSAGATLNQNPIHVGGRTEFDGARLLASRAFINERHWATPWPGEMTVETRASIAYRMALVAAGEFDAMVSLSEKAEWDLAAADLIVHEAGGLVTTGTGEMLAYNKPVPAQESVVCANPALHVKLLERLKELRN
jgi:myo-inositol-1(or 4)-monophosphatase